MALLLVVVLAVALLMMQKKKKKKKEAKKLEVMRAPAVGGRFLRDERELCLFSSGVTRSRPLPPPRL